MRKCKDCKSPEGAKPFVRGRCKVCNNKVEAFRKEKLKNKSIEAKKVQDKTLDSYFSKIVRILNPEICHGCQKSFDYNNLQCAHFVSRKYYLFRWDIRNALPACKQCNFFEEYHIWNLGKHLNRIWGDKTADFIIANKDQTKTMDKIKRLALYEVLIEVYNSININMSKEEKDSKRQYLFNKLIDIQIYVRNEGDNR